MRTIRCTWDAVAGVDGYNVYIKDNGAFVRRNLDLITDTTYEIEDVEEGEHEGYAKSVLNGVESNPSNVKGFEIIPLPPVEPDAPTNFDVNVVDDVAQCAWTAAPEADGYNVYLKSNGEFVKHNSALIVGTTYNIENLENGNYEAYATSVLDDLESDSSNTKVFEVDVVPVEPETGIFTADGMWSWAGAGQPTHVNVLVVAGGGGGGAFRGAGGGAGGVLWEENVPVSGDVAVTVGQGGAGAYHDGGAAISAEQGEDSSFGDIVATGGGRGGNVESDNWGGDGGSGGGSGGRASGGAQVPGTGIEGQGHEGGLGRSAPSTFDRAGGGGGGAGRAGFNYRNVYAAPSFRTIGGHGAFGVDMSSHVGIEHGDDGWFGGGGGGSQHFGTSQHAVYTSGDGGQGGGGDGNADGDAEDGMPNTGGGGGAAGGASTFSAGSGGSGFVMVIPQ